MYYKKDEFDYNYYVNKCIEIVKEKNLYSTHDIWVSLPLSKEEFLRMGLHKAAEVKRAVEQNKINDKLELYKNWLKSTNATMQANLYKVIACDEERQKLNSNYKPEYRPNNKNISIEDLFSGEEISLDDI